MSTIRTVDHCDISIGAPSPDDISLLAIATGLSKICRFNGQIDGWYSVAEHSVHVSRLVPPEHARVALLHDAAEALIGDVISPLKAELPDYKVIEARFEYAMAQAFGIPFPFPAEVKVADLRMLEIERHVLRHEPTPGPREGDPRPEQWPWPNARRNFLQRAIELGL